MAKIRVERTRLFYQIVDVADPTDTAAIWEQAKEEGYLPGEWLDDGMIDPFTPITSSEDQKKWLLLHIRV